MAESKHSNSPVAIIMAGGSGTRFWPVSQKNLPKQYLKLTGKKTLIEETVDRITPLCAPEHIYISSGESQASLLNQFVPQIANRILEPSAKNTAACLMLAVSRLIKDGFSLDTPVMVFPSDHAIGNAPAFERVLKEAIGFAKTQDALITIGIKPTYPHTGYGYIERGEVSSSPGIFKVKRFTEKPKLDLATQFFSSPNYYWNGGIFVWSIRSICTAFENFLGASWTQIHSSKNPNELEKVFSSLPSVPIDTAILEKSPHVYMIQADNLDWSDLGSWKALYDFYSSNPTTNVSLNSNTHSLDSQGCLVYSSSNFKVGLIGVKDLVVVEHDGFLLIADKSQDQRVKELSQEFNS